MIFKYFKVLLLLLSISSGLHAAAEEPRDFFPPWEEGHCVCLNRYYGRAPACIYAGLSCCNLMRDIDCTPVASCCNILQNGASSALCSAFICEDPAIHPQRPKMGGCYLFSACLYRRATASDKPGPMVVCSACNFSRDDVQEECCNFANVFSAVSAGKIDSACMFANCGIANSGCVSCLNYGSEGTNSQIILGALNCQRAHDSAQSGCLLDSRGGASTSVGICQLNENREGDGRPSNLNIGTFLVSQGTGLDNIGCCNVALGTDNQAVGCFNEVGGRDNTALGCFNQGTSVHAGKKSYVGCCSGCFNQGMDPRYQVQAAEGPVPMATGIFSRFPRAVSTMDPVDSRPLLDLAEHDATKITALYLSRLSHDEIVLRNQDGRSALHILSARSLEERGVVDAIVQVLTRMTLPEVFARDAAGLSALVYLIESASRKAMTNREDLLLARFIAEKAEPEDALLALKKIASLPVRISDLAFGPYASGWVSEFVDLIPLLLSRISIGELSQVDAEGTILHKIAHHLATVDISPWLSGVSDALLALKNRERRYAHELIPQRVASKTYLAMQEKVKRHISKMNGVIANDADAEFQIAQLRREGLVEANYHEGSCTVCTGILTKENIFVSAIQRFALCQSCYFDLWKSHDPMKSAAEMGLLLDRSDIAFNSVSFEQYSSILGEYLKVLKKQMPGFAPCPEDCGRGRIVRGGDTSYDCECGFHGCLKCSKIHGPEGCGEYQKYLAANRKLYCFGRVKNFEELFARFPEARDWEIDSESDSLLFSKYRACPTKDCHILAEKDEGCDNVRCAMCGHQWKFSQQDATPDSLFSVGEKQMPL